MGKLPRSPFEVRLAATLFLLLLGDGLLADAMLQREAKMIISSVEKKSGIFLLLLLRPFPSHPSHPQEE